MHNIECAFCKCILSTWKRPKQHIQILCTASPVDTVSIWLLFSVYFLFCFCCCSIFCWLLTSCFLWCLVIYWFQFYALRTTTSNQNEWDRLKNRKHKSQERSYKFWNNSCAPTSTKRTEIERESKKHKPFIRNSIHRIGCHFGLIAFEPCEDGRTEWESPEQTKKQWITTWNICSFFIGDSVKDERIQNVHSRRINFRWFPFWMGDDADYVLKENSAKNKINPFKHTLILILIAIGSNTRCSVQCLWFLFLHHLPLGKTKSDQKEHICPGNLNENSSNYWK